MKLAFQYPITFFFHCLLSVFLFIQAKYLIRRGNIESKMAFSPNPFLFLCFYFSWKICLKCWKQNAILELGCAFPYSLERENLLDCLLLKWEQSCREDIGPRKIDLLKIFRQNQAPVSSCSVVARNVTFKPECWVWSRVTLGMFSRLSDPLFSTLQNSNSGSYSITLLGRVGELTYTWRPYLCLIYNTTHLCY